MSDECRSLLSLDSQGHWRDGCLVSLEIAKKVFLFLFSMRLSLLFLFRLSKSDIPVDGVALAE